jgi:hypothetical protein
MLISLVLLCKTVRYIKNTKNIDIGILGAIISILDFYTFSPMKMEWTEYSKTSAYKIQAPGNYPEESIQHN